jgi:hypothetical protein
MVYTIAAQIGYSDLVSTTPAPHTLLGEFRGGIFEFYSTCNTDDVLYLRSHTIF